MAPAAAPPAAAASPAAAALPPPTAQPPGDDAAARQNLLLLIQLRWIAVVGQLVTVAGVTLGLGVPVPTRPMTLVLAGLAALNLASLWRLSRPRPVAGTELALAMLLDVAALTLQLFLTGGATNPFVFLYLLQVTLGAVLLDGRAAWILAGVTGLCFAGLTVLHLPLDFSRLPDGSLTTLRILGLLICFLLDAGLLVAFVGRVNRNLRERDARLAALRQRAAEEDLVVRMGLLASGAAHELGTPLATLSVILGDWRRMPALVADPELRAELDAMEGEVRRCKAILTGILVSAGEIRGESAGVTTLYAFLDDLVAGWRAARPTAQLRYEKILREDMPIVSDASLKQAVVNVLDNAFEVSPGWLRFEVQRDGGLLNLAVTDRGPGFAPEILEGIGAPYRSSKGRQGGGLGLFLVANVVRKLGGRLAAANRLGGGAVVTLSLPLAALAVKQEGCDDV